MISRTVKAIQGSKESVEEGKEEGGGGDRGRGCKGGDTRKERRGLAAEFDKMCKIAGDKEGGLSCATGQDRLSLYANFKQV